MRAEWDGDRLYAQGLKNLQPWVNPTLHDLELNSNSCEKKRSHIILPELYFITKKGWYMDNLRMFPIEKKLCR